MKVYVAADIDEQKEAKVLADALTERGHEIVSSWVYAPEIHEVEGTATDEERANVAVAEVSEICNADCLVVLTKSDGNYCRGGRHIETGVAIGNDLDVIVIGPRENVFHYWPGVKHYHSARDALAFAPALSWAGPFYCSAGLHWVDAFVDLSALRCPRRAAVEGSWATVGLCARCTRHIIADDLAAEMTRQVGRGRK